MPIIRVREIKSPIALATCGAFLVPEPLGICFVLVAGIWWLWRKIGLQQTGFFGRNADAATSAWLICNRTVALIVRRLFTSSAFVRPLSAGRWAWKRQGRDLTGAKPDRVLDPRPGLR